MPEEKLQMSIYKLDLGSSIFEGEDEEMSILSDVIVAEGYRPQSLRAEGVDDYRLKLFYKSKSYSPSWKGFVASLAARGQSILRRDRSASESFVMLLLSKTTDNIYAFTGGQGYFVIQEYIDDDFGIDVFARLISKGDKILKSTREKSVVGGVMGSTKHFRNKYNLFENDSFGKIYQELQASLDKETLVERFGFTSTEVEKGLVCIAKPSFKINKAISLSQLIKIIDGCEYVLNNFEAEPINNVEKIIKKKNPGLVSKLFDVLFKQLRERYSQGEAYRIDFDLCHKDFEGYLGASKYVVRKNTSERNFFGEFEFVNGLVSIDTLFEKIRRLPSPPENLSEFTQLFSSLKIYAYDDDGNETTRGWLVNHILGDVLDPEDNKRYFFIDKAWYMIKDQFIKNLNESCSNFIKNNSAPVEVRPWNYPADDENDYNKDYIGEESTMVLHKVTPDNIEVCDVLKWDDNNLYLIHVKKGFDNSMRDLCAQISVAASRIILDRNADEPNRYIKRLYEEMEAKAGSEDPYFKSVGEQKESLNKQDFVELFKKNITFVVAVLDTGVSQRDIGDIEGFNSNIAKFSLQELVKEMAGSEVNLKVAQIAKS